MSIETRHDARLEQAHAEVGRTAIGRPVACALVVLFGIIIASVPLLQVWGDPTVLLGAPTRAADRPVAEPPPQSMSVLTRVMAGNRALLRAIGRFTDRLDHESQLARRVRPAVQLAATRLVGTGNEQVYPGRDGWLYYATDVQHVVGPGFLDGRQLARRAASGDSLSAAPTPAPRPALRTFNDGLARRGITLVLMPTPVKPSIHPEYLAGGAPEAPLQNLSFSRFADEMRAAGILVFDPAPLLTALGSADAPVYLARDTHWRPEAVVAVAEELVRFLDREALVPRRGAAPGQTTGLRVASQGDIVDLLSLPADRSPYTDEVVDLGQVMTPDREPWRADPSAELLLLGDSFSNIYSLQALGWGRSAGLAEQLSLALGGPVDRLVQNDNGAFATRETLARELAAGRDRLAGKRVVIYQFATRELSHGDWRLVDLDTRAPAPTRPGTVLTPEPGQTLSVRGRVRQLTPPPRPGTVPYRDHIIAIDLADIVADGAPTGGSEALVYLSSMEDNVWTAAASLTEGQIISITLRPWSDVAPDLDGITRAELSEGNVVFAVPWWGELIEP